MHQLDYMKGWYFIKKKTVDVQQQPHPYQSMKNPAKLKDHMRLKVLVDNARRGDCTLHTQFCRPCQGQVSVFIA
jgi:hypothetical protein